MSKRKAGPPSVEPETKSPLPVAQPREEINLDDEIARIRETQDNPLLADDLGTAIVQIKVDRPKKNHYFRVMPPPEKKGYLAMSMIDGASLSNVPKNWYAISDSLARSLQEYAKGIKRYALIPTIDRDGNVRVWPHSLANEGQAEAWFESRQRVIAEAVKRWIRFEANSHESRYEIIPARDQSLEPKWPLDLGYDDLIKRAIGDHYVASHNHQVIRSLRGDSLHKVESDE